MTPNELLGIGGAMLALLALVYWLMASDPKPAKPKKSAITNPPWASFQCPECGHTDGSIGNVVKCANCGLNLLRFRSR